MSSREDNFLVKSPLLGYATIHDAVFSIPFVPSNSRTTVLCNPFLSNGTVNTSTIIGVFYWVCAECPFYQRRNKERRKKTKIFTLNKYIAMGLSGLDAKSDRAGWLPAVSYCSALQVQFRAVRSLDSHS
jgi:hypothetical protein